jgi:hypothetical protein
MNPIVQKNDNPSPGRTRVQQWARVVLTLSSFAALPGLIAGVYPVIFVFASIVEGADRDDWIVPVVLTSIIIVGWWLYWTYWREVSGKNRLGKISWLVSALYNIALAIVPLAALFRTAKSSWASWLVFILWLSWLVVVITLSIRIWIAKLKNMGES